MYVSYDDYSKLSPNPMGEGEYTRVAPIADAVIDDWTLQRVGKAVKNGEKLPEIVVTVYSTLCDSVPGLMSGSTVDGGGVLSSFSNGIDSYGFDTTSSTAKTLQNSLGWLIELLPIEWCSVCVSFDGGNKYAS